MTKEEIQIYTRRITSGNKTDLVVTTYDIILTYFRDATLALEQEEKEAFVWNMQKAADFLNELIHALDCKYQVARDLMSLYRYVQQIIQKSILKNENQGIEEACGILEKLKVAFEEVAKQDLSGPVISQGGQVYAGLTYGKNSLNELYDNMSHGFKA